MLIFGLLIFTTIVLVHQYLQRDVVAKNLVQTSLFSPISTFLDQHNLSRLLDGAISFSVYALIGILIYCLVYVCVAIYTEVYNEKLAKSFQHPIQSQQSWNRFFSAQALRVILVGLFIGLLFVMLGRIAPMIYQNLLPFSQSSLSSQQILHSVLVELVGLFVLSCLAVIVRVYRAIDPS